MWPCRGIDVRQASCRGGAAPHFASAPGIVIGNVTGSNIAKILFLGLTAMIASISIQRVVVRQDVIATILIPPAGLAIMLRGQARRVVGAALLVGLAAYLWVTVRAGRRVPAADAPAMAVVHAPIWRGIALTVGGIAMTFLGAHLLVQAATRIVNDLRLPLCRDTPECRMGLSCAGTMLPM